MRTSLSLCVKGIYLFWLCDQILKVNQTQALAQLNKKSQKKGSIKEMSKIQREGQYNDKNELIDLYIPRKCAVTNKVIGAKDKSSVQLNIGQVKKMLEIFFIYCIESYFPPMSLLIPSTIYSHLLTSALLMNLGRWVHQQIHWQKHHLCFLWLHQKARQSWCWTRRIAY